MNGNRFEAGRFVSHRPLNHYGLMRILSLLVTAIGALLAFAIFFLASGSIASAYMSNDEIVNSMSKNKVGRAPQNGRTGGPHPRYLKLEEVIPAAKHKKKAHRK